MSSLCIFGLDQGISSLRCVNCDHKAKEPDTGKYSLGQCPNCGHRVALSPQTDGATDFFIKRCIDGVSKNKAYYYLEDHLFYEVRRRSSPPNDPKRIASALGVMGTIAVSLIVFVFTGFNIFVLFVAIALVAGLTAVALGRPHTNPRNVIHAIRAYERINPPTHKISESVSAPGEGDTTVVLDGQPAARLLLCENPEYARFYLVHEFHLENNCVVMGGCDIPTGDQRHLFQNLRRQPKLDVFVVHDLTPRGLAFANTVQSSTDWFGSHESATVIDIGLLPEQTKLFERELHSLRDEDKIDGNDSVPELPIGKGVRLTFLRPERLLNLTAQSIEERVPFHELQRYGSDAGGGDDDGGYDDSE